MSSFRVINAHTDKISWPRVQYFSRYDLLSAAKQGDNGLGSVCLSVRLFVCPLTAEPFDLPPSNFAWRLTLTLPRLACYVCQGRRSKVKCQKSRFYMPITLL